MCVRACVRACVRLFLGPMRFFFFCKGGFRSRVNVGRDSINPLLLWNIPTRIGKLEIFDIVGSAVPTREKKYEI